MLDTNQNILGRINIYFFSKKAFILSLVFLTLNILFFNILIYNQNKLKYNLISPKIYFSDSQNIKIKTMFDKGFKDAKNSQFIFTGTEIVSDENSYAELRIEDDIIRLDANTKIKYIENNFKDSKTARFIFELESGNLWVNSHNKIEIRTKNAILNTERAMISYEYQNKSNKINVIIGNVDLNLLDNNSNPLISYVIPVKNKVQFFDSQIIPEYSKLKYSKLKKELKMTLLSKDILNNAWVSRNIKKDYSDSKDYSDLRLSISNFYIKNFYYFLEDKFSIFNFKKDLAKLNKINLNFNYILSNLQSSNNKGKTRDIIKNLEEIFDKNNKNILSLIDEYFYKMQNIEIDSPAYLLKNSLRKFILADGDIKVLRSYLEDLDYNFSINKVQNAEDIAKNWLKDWKEPLQKKYLNEFENENRIFLSILLSNADKISSNILKTLDKASEIRLNLNNNNQETLFDVALEKLEISTSLINAYKYNDAKKYLKISYGNLKVSEKDVNLATKEIFLEKASILAERIAYADEYLHFAKMPINEKDFSNYLSKQKLNKNIEERFIQILETDTETPKDKVVLPKKDEVIDRFTIEGIIVIDQDVEVSSESPFVFNIKEANILNFKNPDNNIIFSAKYDYNRDAIYDIFINKEEIKGNFSLSEFMIITKNKFKEKVLEEEKDDDPNIIITDPDEDIKRNELAAQNLAINLTMKELALYNIYISQTNKVEVLNDKLSQFRIKEASISTDDKKQEFVKFDYNSNTKYISNISVTGSELSFIGLKVKSENFTAMVFEKLYKNQEDIKTKTMIISEFKKENLIVEDINIEILKNNNALIKNIKVKDIPITIDSIKYSINNKIAIEAKHVLLNSSNIKLHDYVSEISKNWVISYLNKQSILISKDNISSELPNSKVKITNYSVGSKTINFTFNISSNKLENIELLGAGTVVKTMTFTEFKNIKF